MSSRPARLGGIAACAVLACLAATPAPAQTTVNPQALDELAPPSAQQAPAHAAPKRKSHRPVRRSASHAAKTSEHAAKPAEHAEKPAEKRPGGGLPNPHAELPGSGTSAHAAPKPPARAGALTMPAAPPTAPVLPPPIVVPTRPAPPPPPVPVKADAPGQVIKQKDGVRITFGADGSDLNPQTDAAIRAIAHDGSPSAATTFTVTAHAAGNADDPSTPRRLSLDRALAVRSVLIAEGIPSQRIYVKALGASVPPGDAPADRVDIAATVPPPTQQQSAAGGTSPAKTP